MSRITQEPSKPMHRTTLEIPMDMYEDAVAAAEVDGLKFSHVVRLALSDWLLSRSIRDHREKK